MNLKTVQMKDISTINRIEAVGYQSREKKIDQSYIYQSKRREKKMT